MNMRIKIPETNMIVAFENVCHIKGVVIIEELYKIVMAELETSIKTQKEELPPPKTIEHQNYLKMILSK